MRVVAATCFILAACSSAPPSDDSTPLPDRDRDFDRRDAGVTAVPRVDGGGSSDAGVGGDGGDDPLLGKDGGVVLRVFAISGTTNARMGGLAGADAICATHAKKGALTGTFVAWLSNKNGPNAVDRITNNGPWHLVSGELVAATKAELVSGTLQHAIDHDESGAVVPASAVWTGTGTNGQYLTNDCDQWTTGNDGRVGRTDQTGAAWTTSGVDDCDSIRKIFCFQK